MVVATIKPLTRFNGWGKWRLFSKAALHSYQVLVSTLNLPVASAVLGLQIQLYCSGCPANGFCGKFCCAFITYHGHDTYAVSVATATVVLLNSGLGSSPEQARFPSYKAWWVGSNLPDMTPNCSAAEYHNSLLGQCEHLEISIKGLDIPHRPSPKKLIDIWTLQKCCVHRGKKQSAKSSVYRRFLKNLALFLDRFELLLWGLKSTKGFSKLDFPRIVKSSPAFFWDVYQDTAYGLKRYIRTSCCCWRFVADRNHLSGPACISVS